jgi:phosphoglycerol transferase MdoB-like AlkP superfamily enzyme
MKNLRFPDRAFSALLPLLSFAWRLLLAMSVARILLVAWQWDRVTEVGMLVPVFVQGLRFDLVLLGLSLVVPALSFPVLASNDRLLPVWRALLWIYLPAVLVLAVFMEFSTPSFINQFDSRPNILFVEYLEYPKEVAATLWAAYKLPLLIAVVCVSVLGVKSVRRFRALTGKMKSTGVVHAAWMFPCLLVMCVGLVRSTLDHRPVNPSTVALSNDPMVNDLALNSTYTVLYAIYEQREESAGGFRYSERQSPKFGRRWRLPTAISLPTACRHCTCNAAAGTLPGRKTSS